MWIRNRLLPAALLVPLLAGSVSAQGIRGRVLDAETGQPVPAATVTLLDAAQTVLRQVVTDSAGGFSLRVAEGGRYHLRTERIGYETVTSPPVDIAAGDTMVVELRLGTEAVVLAPLTITASSRRSPRDRTLDEFYERQRRGWGRFFSPTEIDRLRPRTVTNLLQGSPGIRIRYGRGTQTTVLMRTGRGNCAPTIYVDGHRMPGNDIDQWVAASSVRAVEVYTRAMETPAEFASVRNWNCGAIVIWTTLRIAQ